MKALLATAMLATAVGVALFAPNYGPGAVLFCAVLSLVVCLILSRAREGREFLIPLFAAGLLVRVLVGTSIHFFGLYEFFGGDAITYDALGQVLAKVWRGELHSSMGEAMLGPFKRRNWGMLYVVGGTYFAVGRNMLAVQFFSAVLGAATAPIIYYCALCLFNNVRVARLSAYFVAFFPSLVLWSSQGLKDGPIVFLLALAMLATLRLGERLSLKYVLILITALFGILSMRFYLFYMIAAAIGGAFIIGKSSLTSRSVLRQMIIIAVLGLAMTYLGVLRSAGKQVEVFGNLQAVQRSRQDQVVRADSGFGKDVDVSTTSGALSSVPLGMIYLLFAPFPWQLANLRQSITLPEMVVWWASFPPMVLGIWFTLKYRLRQALPILVFTTMLTLAYSVFQGNIGTAYRQRSQLLVFYFIFASVGFILIKERRENHRRQSQLEAMRPAALAGGREQVKAPNLTGFGTAGSVAAGAGAENAATATPGGTG